MKKLPEKLHSQNGASILLALLFLLVCMMVAASVLMAAVSNAGKIRSNYEEQQRYLALSSALRLVADELEQAEYRGWYTVYEWNETITGKDENGQDVEISNIDYYMIRQDLGAFSCGPLSELDEKGRTPTAGPDGGGAPLDEEVLTFRKELDRVFAKEFTGTGYVGLSDSNTAPLPTNPPGAALTDSLCTTRILTVSVQSGVAQDERFKDVTVEINMNQNCRIHLTAKLDAGTDAGGTPRFYTMEAELFSSAMPAVSYSPGTRLPKNDIPLSGTLPEGELKVTPEPSEMAHKDATKDAVTWQLDWITREVKTEEAGG